MFGVEIAFVLCCSTHLLIGTAAKENDQIKVVRSIVVSFSETFPCVLA